MRNLKKILALVLALVMSLSLMATAGASQFPDVDDSNPYKTAIDVLDELKVFQGFEDGTFKPTDTLNRAQAAVLVYRIATGDVENKYLDNYTYMAQSKFNDLDGYNWAKGYINYCQNAGIVVGTSATTFDPGAPVTGYQLLVMVLRTLGYGKAGEFTDPKGWELQTASIAESEGITKNVTTGDFGAPAPRQMVAEILFRGLLSETVQYSPLTPGGYTKSGETLGKRELGLEDIKGVVMANEFADLEDDDTLADGKTRLDVDGKVYNLDVKSELTDIGEIRHAYVQNGTKVLTTLENQGNSVVNQPENGAATKVKDLSKTNSDTQYFLNFEETAKYSSAYKIKYVTVYDSAAEATAAQKRINDASGAKTGSTEWARISNDGDGNATVVTRTIPAKDTITSVDLSMMKEIFGVKDKWAGEDSLLESGAVYVGTQSIVDISDVESEDLKYSYDKFEEEFITDKNIAIEDSDNGEWLKTIDNDGDGVAEYVFRTDFVMSVIADYNTKKETYFVEFDAASVGTDRKVNDSIKASAIVTEEELKVGDVILYTWIDGKCYVSYPEIDTAAIDKKGIDYKNKTITCGDTTYDWSGIEQEAYHYYHDVSEAQVQVNYNLYKDHFGYVRLFAEANKGFVLLTDGFYATDLKRDHTYKAEIWDNAAEELAEVDVANDNFIDTALDNDNGGDNKREEGTWDRLLAFEESYSEHVDPTAVGGRAPRTYVTTIAAYDVNSDGVYSLDAVGTYTGRYAYTQHELDVNSFEKGSLKDKDLKVTVGHTDDNENLNRINATDETLYYYVQYEQSDKRQHPVVVDVDTWTGYSNSSVKLAAGDRAYAVTLCYRNTDNTEWLNYETAEIIVIEHEVAGEPNTVFPVTLTQRLIGSNNRIGGNGFVWDDETGKWILNDFEGRYADHDNPSVGVRSLGDNNVTPVDISDLLRFYEIDETGALNRIDEDYADYNIYAGVIVTEIGTVSRSYGEIGLSEGHADDDARTLEPKHDFYKSSDNFYTIGYDRDAATDKDEMLRLPGLQNTTLYGDVASTFSADALDAIHMNRGDKVIYVTDGDGVVQSIINVTDSTIKVNGVTTFPGVYEGDKHSTADVYDETWTLMDLWGAIADEQGDGAGLSAGEMIDKAEALLDDENTTAAQLKALQEQLQKLVFTENDDGTINVGTTDEEKVNKLTVAEYEALQDLLGENGNDGDVANAITAAELKEAKEAAATTITEMASEAKADAAGDDAKISAINNVVADAEALVEAADDADDVTQALNDLQDAIIAILDGDVTDAADVLSSDPNVTVSEDENTGDPTVHVGTGATVTNSRIKSTLKVRTGLTPSVDDADKPEGVRSITFAEQEAETLAEGDPVEEAPVFTTWEMTITLDAGTTSLPAPLDFTLTLTEGEGGGDTTTQISSVTIDTITLTNDGAWPTTATVTAPDNGIVSAAVTWKAENGDALAADAKPATGTTYKATITFTLDTGYEFAADATCGSDTIENNAVTISVTC